MTNAETFRWTQSVDDLESRDARRGQYLQCRNALRDMFDPGEFASAWRTGQQMDLDQAVAYSR